MQPGQPFAVKFVDFTAPEKDIKTAHFLGQTQEKRESYEVEKQIMTYANHPNITPIRMAINMGEPGIFKYQNSNAEFVQYERVYLIMDLAELGSLMDFVKKKLTPSHQIKLSRDCFAGMPFIIKIIF